MGMFVPDGFTWEGHLKKRTRYNKKKRNKQKLHEWEMVGEDPGWLGREYGDSIIMCRRCKKRLRYAAIDHNIFASWDKQECAG